MSFGFSVGDFVSTLELVATVISALKAVQALELEESRYVELAALRCAASQCQNAIEQFWKKQSKSQPYLDSAGSSSKVKDGLMKIRWTLCEADELARFKSDLMGHTQAIQLLIGAIHLANAHAQSKKQDERNKSLVNIVEELLSGCSRGMATLASTGKLLLELVTKIMWIDICIFQVVLRLHATVTKLPSQVERQQPVYLIDAMDRHMPFHLEFINSTEAFLTVLKMHFRDFGNASLKIDMGQIFFETNGIRGSYVDHKDWKTAFSPGQHVLMYMLEWNTARPVYCPDCGYLRDKYVTSKRWRFQCRIETECTECNLKFKIRDNMDVIKQLYGDSGNDGTKYSTRLPLPRPPDSTTVVEMPIWKYAHNMRWPAPPLPETGLSKEELADIQPEAFGITVRDLALRPRLQKLFGYKNSEDALTQESD